MNVRNRGLRPTATDQVRDWGHPAGASGPWMSGNTDFILSPMAKSVIGDTPVA